MPSLDVIRNVTIKGQADAGVDQATAALNKLTESIKAANDNLAQSREAAKASSEGWSITGEGALSAANHLRQAAEAAYVFSPAFRSVTNEMAAPALKGAHIAIEALAVGMVTATNVAGTGLVKLGTAAATVSPAFVPLGASIKAAGVAMEAFSPTLGGAATTILSKLLPALGLLGKGLLIYDAIKLVTQAWELGNAKLAEYVALSEKAVAAGVSTDFYQRIAKGAEAAKTPIEALTKAFENLNNAAAPKLGGSAGQNRLDELTKAGNFNGNTGVKEIAGANSTEERFRAITSLIDQAIQKGERLAALDVAKTFLGDQVARNLEKDSGYLDKMLDSAAKVAAEDLVSQQEIQNAVELQNRLDAAEKILSQRWHPIQDALTQLGIKMKEAWVGIVESIAGAVDQAAKLLSKLGEAPPWFQKQLDRGATAFMEMTTTPESRKAAEEQYGITSDPAAMADLAAQQAQEAARKNSELMKSARDRLAEAMHRKFDKSKAPGDEPDSSAYDRAEEALRKYTETAKAAAVSVDLNINAQERLKAIAQLTAAGMKDGLTREAAAAKAELSGLAKQAGDAAEALERARVASEIKFGANTALLSQDDVQIATRLKGLYPDVATALNSVEAQGMRANSALREISSSIENSLTGGLTDIVSGTKSASQGFADMASSIARSIEQMIIKILIVEPLMRSLQQSIGGSGLLSLFGAPSAAGAATTTGAAGVGGLGGLYHTGGVVGSEPTAMRYVHPAYFDDAPRFHTGGIAGDEVPIIAKRGEGVFTPGQMAAMGNGAGAMAGSFGDIHITVTVPESTSSDNAEAIGMAVRSSMTQVIDERLAYHSRARGMLNNAG